MAVEYKPIHPPLAVCDICEASKPFREDPDDEEGMGYHVTDGFAEARVRFAIPKEWVCVVGSRLEANPEWQEEYDAMRELLQQQAQAVLAQGGTDDQRRMIEADIRQQLEDYEPPVPRLLATRVETMLCPEHAEMLQSRLGAPEWGEFEGE
jgi:hypothetical protein